MRRPISTVLLFLTLLAASCWPSKQPPCPLCFPASYQGDKRYVSPGGNDANSGLSPDQAWETVQYAVDQAIPGMEIILMDGVYHERVEIKNSGTCDKPIILRAANRGKAEIDGNSSKPWGNTQITLEIRQASYILLDGIVFTHKIDYLSDTTVSQVRGLQIGPRASYICVVNNEFRDMEKAEVPKSYIVPIFVQNLYTDTVATHHIYFKGNHMEGIDLRSYPSVDPVTGKRDSFDAVGLILSGNIEHIGVVNNTFKNLNGIAVNPAGNYAYQVVDKGKAPLIDPSLDHSRYVVISENRFINISHGIATYIDGGRNVLVERNYYENCINGVSVVTERITTGINSYSNKTWVRNNVFCNCARSLFAGMWLDSVGRTSYNPVEDVYFTNNSVYSTANPSQGSSYLMGLRSGIMGDSKCYNNIFDTPFRMLDWGHVATFPFTMQLDYNLWHKRNPGIKPFRQFKTDYYGNVDTVDYTFQEFRAETSWDTQGDSLKVDFVGGFDPCGPDPFKLVSGSAAIDRGLAVKPLWAYFGDYVPAEELDFFGNPRVHGKRIDVGAHEYQP